jgi:Ras-related protein Rab-7A
MSSNVYDIFKVLVVGETKVGKTSIVNQYVHFEFRENTIPTQSFNPLVKELDDKKVTLQFWDMAGGIGEKSRDSFLKNANIVLFVYDVTDAKSFETIEKYREKMGLIGMMDGAVTVLIGNKKDQKMSSAVTVDTRIATEYANGKFDFFEEVSAKDGINIKGLFAKIVEKLKPSVIAVAEPETPRAYEKYKAPIEALMGKYQCQIDSCAPYPGKNRKGIKVQGLSSFLDDLKNGKNPVTAIKDITDRYQEIRTGKKTDALLKQIETDSEFTTPSPN